MCLLGIWYYVGLFIWNYQSFVLEMAYLKGNTRKCVSFTLCTSYIMLKTWSRVHWMSSHRKSEMWWGFPAHETKGSCFICKLFKSSCIPTLNEELPRFMVPKGALRAPYSEKVGVKTCLLLPLNKKYCVQIGQRTMVGSLLTYSMTWTSYISPLFLLSHV